MNNLHVRQMDNFLADISRNRTKSLLKNEYPKHIVLNPYDLVNIAEENTILVNNTIIKKEDILDLGKPIDLMIFGMVVYRSIDIHVNKYLIY